MLFRRGRVSPQAGDESMQRVRPLLRNQDSCYGRSKAKLGTIRCLQMYSAAWLVSLDGCEDEA